jgi:hypothetical protein
MEIVEGQVCIVFEGVTRAQGSRAAQRLKDHLVDQVGGDVDISIEAEDDDSQDAGSTLVLLFGSAAAVAIARGIRAFLERRADPRDHIVIKTGDGTEVIASGEAARNLDAAALVRASVTKRRPKGT